MTPKTQATNQKIEKLDFIKIKNLCSSKDTIKKVKRHKEWKKGFPGGAVIENPPANAGDVGLSPGLGGPHMLWSG